MLRGILGGTFAVAVMALAAALATSVDARGGNHGCNVPDRSMYTNHFFASGDNIVVGYYTEEVGFPPSTQETIRSENTGSDGSGPSGIACGADEFTWTLVRSALGPGDDSIRFDGVGIQGKLPTPARPLPRRVATLIRGGAGDDVIRDHDGVGDIGGGPGDDKLIAAGGRDLLRGNGGNDVIKAAGGGRDRVRCGPGRDKAIVDRRDDVRGCEKVIVR